MKSQRARSRLEKLAEDIRAKQNNIVWPGPLVNSRGIDAFLWRGSPSLTIVQRVAAWLFGLTYIGAAMFLSVLAWHEGGTGLVLLGGIALGGFALGIKTVSNGFPKHPRVKR